MVDYLVENFNDSDWIRLQELGIDLKHEYIMSDEFEDGEWSYEFSSQHIKDPSLTIPISDIYPRIKLFRLSIDEDEYILVDQHCKKTGCECTQVFLYVIKNRVQGKMIEYNWLTGESDSPEYDWLIAYFIEHYDNFIARLSSRSIKVKFAYNTAKLKLNNKKIDLYKGLPQNQRLEIKPKIGRNAPCPCGSGKKYKKCCLGKV